MAATKMVTSFCSIVFLGTQCLPPPSFPWAWVTSSPFLFQGTYLSLIGGSGRLLLGGCLLGYSGELFTLGEGHPWGMLIALYFYFLPFLY